VDAADTASATAHRDAAERESSVLFLRIFAAADYFTPNKTLMENVPLVHVDIILDPFVLNVLPRSLLPTAAFMVLVAFVSWFLGNRVAAWLQSIAQDDTPSGKKKQ